MSMNLLYEAYPESVNLYGVEREIVTDFKDWLRFIDMIRCDGLSQDEKMTLMMEMYLENIPHWQWGDAHEPLMSFFRMDECTIETGGEPEGTDEELEPVIPKPLYDFAFDAKYIISGFRQDYKIDLTETDMHWWKFRILLDGLSSGTEFKQRVMYRNTNTADIKDVKERQRIQRIQRAIAIPQPAPSDYEIGDMFG